jgi:nucleotide-binding universal stress UspA family protein
MKILVPLKVPFDPEMAKIGIRLAKITGAELTFLNVCDTTPFKGHIKVSDTILDQIKVDGGLMLTEAAGMAHKEGIEAVTKIAEGKPYDTILKEEENADMLVLRIRKFSGEKKVGSVTKELLESCRKPIYVFKGVQRDIKRILLAVDESECSQEAVKFSLALAKLLGIKNVSTIYVARSSDKLDTGNETLEKAKERGKTMEIELDSHLIKGDPAKRILDLSEDEFDLIIMGAVGQGTLSKFFLGNVARKVTNFAGCDVIVVPPCK